MIVLHMFLLLQYWKQQNDGQNELGKLLVEAFFSELDASLREMGVGDLSVPKRMRKLADAFYSRLTVYSQALEGNEKGRLEEILKRNMYAQAENRSSTDLSKDIEKMGQYIQNSYKLMDTMKMSDSEKGVITFPDPQKLDQKLDQQAFETVM